MTDIEQAIKLLRDHGYFVCPYDRIKVLKGIAGISSLIKSVGGNIDEEREYVFKKKARELWHDALVLGLIDIEDAKTGDGDRYKMTATLVMPEARA